MADLPQQLSDFEAISRNLSRVAESQDLKMEMCFHLIPPAEQGGPHAIMAVLRTTTPEEREKSVTDLQFDAMMKADAEAGRVTQREQVQQATEEDLRRIADDLDKGGLL